MLVRSVSQDSRRRPHNRRRLRFDCLEARELLSVTTPGTEFQVPTAPTGVQFTNSHAVAMDSGGDAVVVWADSQTTANGIWANGPLKLEYQLYTNNAGTLTAGAGGQLQTTSGSPITSNWPTSIMSSVPNFIEVARAPTSGNFAAAWLTLNPNGSYATYAQLYNSAGTPLTNPTLVGGSGANKLEAIAMSDSGFDVLYGASEQLDVQRYSSTGAAQGSPIKVVRPQEGLSADGIAMDANGNFVVAWNDVIPGSNQHNAVFTINAQRYTSAGKASGPVINVFTSSPGSLEHSPNVGMDSADDFVVDWVGYTGLMAETVYANNSLGGAAVVDPAGSVFSGQQTPALAVQPNGNYAISWVDPGSSNYVVLADTFLLSGAPQQAPFTIYQSSNNSAYQYTSAAVDSNGDLLVIYSGYGAGPASDGGVFGDFFLDPPAPPSAPASAPTSAGASSSGGSAAAVDAVFGSLSGDDDTIL